MTTSKKLVLKRLLSMTLVAVLCLSMFPIPARAASGATLTNGKPVTEENVLALIEEYRNGKEPGEIAKDVGFDSYTNGSSYDAYNPSYRIVLPSGGIQGTECAKFAFAFFDDIFGANAPIREVTNPTDVRPGDLLRFSGHWSVVTSVEGLYVHDVGGGSTGRIGWTDLDVSIENSLVAAYTRYPLPWAFDQSELLFDATSSLGTPITSLGLDTEAHLYATRDGQNKDFFIPIIWDEAGEYDEWVSDQTISGRLDISDYPELADAKIPTVTADITLTGDIPVEDVTLVEPGFKEGKTGDSWDSLNIPSFANITITYANGEEEMVTVGVEWDTASYNPNQSNLTGDPQVIKGTIVIDDTCGVLYTPEFAEWAEKLRNEGIEVTIALYDHGTGVIVQGEPFEATGHFGDDFFSLTNLPRNVLVTPQYASGTTFDEPFEAYVLWNNETEYDPYVEEQVVTGKLNFREFPGDFPETNISVKITLTRDPDDEVEYVMLVSPLKIDGIKGVPFNEQPLPDKIEVRVGYKSMCTDDIEVGVSWVDSGFDPNADSVQKITGNLIFPDGAIPEGTDPAILKVEMPISVRTHNLSVSVPELSPIRGYLGADLSEIKSRAPESVQATILNSDNTQTTCEMSVDWDWRLYNPMLEEQVIHGTLVMGSEFDDMTSPDIQLIVRLSEKPTYAVDFEKTYDGKNMPLPVEKPEGCTGYTIRYAGTTVIGNTVQGTYPPSEAGTYTATVTLMMSPGYDAGEPLTVNYTIHQKEQPFDTPVRVVSMSDSIAATPVDGAEYRVDDGEWQSSPVFTGLKPETTYTVYQRLKGSADGNYKPSEPTSVQVTTSKTGTTSMSVPFVPEFESKTYDGAGLLDGLTRGRYDVDFGGQTVTVNVSAFLSSDHNPSITPQNYDQANSVSNPTTVGPYVIRYELPTGYVWADTGSQAINTGVWIYPKFSDIYVGDKLADVTMEGGTPDANSQAPAYKLDFNLSSADGAMFDTDQTGKSTIPVMVGVLQGTGEGSTAALDKVSFPVTVLPWVITGKDVPTVKVANDASFDESMLPATISVTAKARDKELTFQVPVTWDASGYDASAETQTIPGTLDFSSIAALNGAEDTSISAVVTRLAAPVDVPFESRFSDKTYDEAGIFDNGKDYTVTVGDADIPVQVTAYIGDSAIENPTAAGKYVIRTELPEGYCWEGAASQTKDTIVWIYPAVNPIYVGDALTDVSFTTGNGDFSFAAGSSPDFSSSVSGETTLSVVMTGPESTETFDMKVSVLPWNMVGKKAVEITGKYGTSFDALTLPDTVTVTAKGGGEEREFEVPVVWSSEDYDAYTEVQTIAGALDFSTIPELSGLTDTAASAVVRLAMNEVAAPDMAAFTKTYDGLSAPMPAPALPVGIEIASISYAGTSLAGVAFGPSAEAPVNAGAYTATVSFTMTAGYAQLADVEVPYVISPAAQAAPEGISTHIVSYDSVVLKPVEGAEYSKDGVVWQSSNSFYDLTANTEYTLYIRMPASQDGNYAPSEALSMSVVTEKRQAQAPTLAPRTVTYNGEAQAYTVAAITGVRETVITYAANGVVLGGAPVDAGEYDVSITYSMEPGYKQLESMTSKLIILKAPQTAPIAAVTASSDISLTISSLSGAEYSIDGGNTWQTSNTFTGLERNTQYTVLVRLAEDKNHEASPAVEVKGKTTTTTSEVPSMLPSYSVTYDGTAKEYVHANALMDIAGVQSMTVTYTGTTNAGAGYRSTTPPTEAGQYAVTISLTAKPGYVLGQSIIGTKLTIERAPQTLTEAPSIAKVTTATVTVNPIAGAEYSGNNGATWQTGNSFTGLAPETSFVILVRLAETPNYLASDAFSLPAQTLADTGLTYEIDFRNETIQFNEQVVEMSLTSFFNGTIASGAAVTPGLMLFARLVDNGAGSVGTVNNIQIPDRPATPDVKCDPASYTMNTTAAMEYSTDNGATWTACEDNVDVAFLGGSVLLVRYAATDESFRSDAKNVFVPTRPEAPSLTVNLVTERVNATSAMEYSSNGGASWQPCQPDMSVANLAGETIMVRTKATATSPSSTSTFLNIPERADAPEYSIQMSAELLTANAPFEYYLNGEWVEAETLRLSELCGQTILIQAPAGDGKFASNRVSVSVPLRGETPVVEVEEQTLTINTAIGMEYSIDNGSTWSAAEVNMDVTPFVGKTMLVRRAVTETMFASNSAVVQIRSIGKAPELTVDMVNETVNTTAEMEYSTDAGSTWTPAPDDLDVSALTGSSLTVRMCGTATEFPSESVTVDIPVRNEAPEVSVNMVNSQITAPAGTQYSADVGNNWMDAPSSIMESMYGTTLLFRTPADETHFASISVPVALPSRPDGPAVSFDMKTLTVNTTSAMEYSSDGGYNWTPAPDGLDVSGLLGKTVLFRYAATQSAPASSNTTLELPAASSAPVVSVDCVNEQLIASESTLEWSQDNGHSWTACKTPMNVGEYAGKELLFRVTGTTEIPASASVPVSVPKRENAPAVDVDTDSESINTTPAMEYSVNGGLSWAQAPMGLDVSQMTGEAVLVRTAHTDSSFASHAVSVTVPTRASSVNVSVDMEKETLNTTTGMDYSLDNGRTWTQAPAGLNVSGMTGSAVLVRSHGTGFQFASEPVSVAIPLRRETPSVNADLRNELFSVSDGAEFSSDGGKTWTGVPASISSEMLGSTVLFRFPADETRFASAPVAVTLPARPDGPTLSLNRDTMTVNTTSDMEYNVDGTWLPASDNMDVNAFQGQTMQFRYAATEATPVSSITELKIPAVTPAPVLSLDITNERIVSDQDGAVLEYSEDGGETWNPCVMPMDIGGLAGKEVMFRTPADGEAPSSAAVTAKIPARAEKPTASLDVAFELVTVKPADGISYSVDGGETWAKLNGSLNISVLTGKTVLVRVACTTENLSSEPTAVVIPARNPAPAATIDMAAETLGADSSMEYSMDGGRTWAAASENLSVSSLTGTNLMLRYAHTDTTLHSETSIFTIPTQLKAPVVSADIRSGKFNAPENAEFSADGGKTWGAVPASIGKDLLGKTVLFRLPATDKNFASAAVTLSVPAHPDAPVLFLNRETLTVSTDTSMEHSIDNGATWRKCVKDMSVSGLLGKTLIVRYAETKNAPASSETVLVIPTRGPAPVVKVYNVSAYGRSDGIIMGTTTGMEYRRVGAASWTKVTGTSIGYLSAGVYEIRYAATADSLASESRMVTVYSPAPDQSGSGTNPWNPGYDHGWFYPDRPGESTGTSGSRYTVKFDTNGGGTVKSQTVKRNGYVEVPQTPVKEGYTFGGWYSDAKLTKLYDFESKVKGSFILYAKWEEVSTIDPGYTDPGDVDPTPIDPTPVDPTPAIPSGSSALVDGDMGTPYVNGRSAGKFEPKAGITRGEVAVILYRLMSENAKTSYYAQSNSFTDVANDSWYNEEISTLVQAGILKGYEDGTFRPDQSVTRAELAAILVRVQGGSEAGSASFTDTNGHWAEGYISSAVTSGLVLGYEDGTFKPNRSITRAEAVTMFNRMLMRSPSDSGSVTLSVNHPTVLHQAEQNEKMQ